MLVRRLLHRPKSLINRASRGCGCIDGARLASSSQSAPIKYEFALVEVGPRDGLQNEKNIVATSDKVSLIERLASAGLPYVESTSFVSAKWVPQMSDHSEVMRLLNRSASCRYPVLVPNEQGLLAAIQCGATDISVFAAASETFSRKNTNCSIEDSLDRLELVCSRALGLGLNIRGYVSCVLGCPYEGRIQHTAVIKVCERLLEMGCEELSLGDTIGVGTAGGMRELLGHMNSAGLDNRLLAVHCHDTYGQALANVLAAFDHGIRVADSSVAGLGGCPYAKGASGNVATEDLLYMLHGLGVKTGVDLDSVIDTGIWISSVLNRPPQSRVTVARIAQAKR